MSLFQVVCECQQGKSLTLVIALLFTLNFDDGCVALPG